MKWKKSYHLNQVIVLGQKIKIENVPPRGEVLGEFCHMSMTIRLDATLPPAQYKTVLIHELTHAALALTGIANYQITEAVEEQLCTLNEILIKDIFNAVSKVN